MKKSAAAKLQTKNLKNIRDKNKNTIIIQFGKKWNLGDLKTYKWLQRKKSKAISKC